MSWKVFLGDYSMRAYIGCNGALVKCLLRSLPDIAVGLVFGFFISRFNLDSLDIPTGIAISFILPTCQMSSETGQRQVVYKVYKLI